MFHRAELERFCERCNRIARSARVAATLFCLVVGATTCVNLRAPTEATATRMPPVVVTRPDGDVGSVRPDMRPMLPSDSAYFRAHPLMVPVEGVQPSELTDTYHAARSAGRIHMATDIMAMRGTPVLAAANGRIIKLANSGTGGIGIYIARIAGTGG